VVIFYGKASITSTVPLFSTSKHFGNLLDDIHRKPLRKIIRTVQEQGVTVLTACSEVADSGVTWAGRKPCYLDALRFGDNGSSRQRKSTFSRFIFHLSYPLALHFSLLSFLLYLTPIVSPLSCHFSILSLTHSQPRIWHYPVKNDGVLPFWQCI